MFRRSTTFEKMLETIKTRWGSNIRKQPLIMSVGGTSAFERDRKRFAHVLWTTRGTCWQRRRTAARRPGCPGGCGHLRRRKNQTRLRGRHKKEKPRFCRILWCLHSNQMDRSLEKSDKKLFTGSEDSGGSYEYEKWNQASLHRECVDAHTLLYGTALGVQGPIKIRYGGHSRVVKKSRHSRHCNWFFIPSSIQQL